MATTLRWDTLVDSFMSEFWENSARTTESKDSSAPVQLDMFRILAVPNSFVSCLLCTASTCFDFLTCFQDLNTFHRGSKLLSPDWRIARLGFWHVSFNRAMDLHPGPTLEALQLIFPSRVRIWWSGKHDTYVKTKPKKHDEMKNFTLIKYLHLLLV